MSLNVFIQIELNIYNQFIFCHQLFNQLSLVVHSSIELKYSSAKS
jgi:hypothetical protein